MGCSLCQSPPAQKYVVVLRLDLEWLLVQAENVHGKEIRAFRMYRLFICSKTLTLVGFRRSVFCCFEGASKFGCIICYMFAFSDVKYTV